MALEGTVNTPLGAVKKKNAVLIGGALVGILGIAWYRSRQNAAATDTGDQTATDEQLYSTDGYQYDTTGGYGGGGGGGYTGYSPPPKPPGPGTFTSNAQWAQYVEQYMIDVLGANPSVVGNAIGKYITGQPVTEDQHSVINSAIAIGDYPPVAGPNGNPPHIVTAGPGPGPGPGQAHNPVTGLHTTSVGRTTVAIAWNKSVGAKSYLVTTQAHAVTRTGGTSISRKTVTNPAASIAGLSHGRTYTIKVHAGPSNNPATADITVTTK